MRREGAIRGRGGEGEEIHTSKTSAKGCQHAVDPNIEDVNAVIIGDNLYAVQAKDHQAEQ